MSIIPIGSDLIRLQDGLAYCNRLKRFLQAAINAELGMPGRDPYAYRSLTPAQARMADAGGPHLPDCRPIDAAIELARTVEFARGFDGDAGGDPTAHPLVIMETGFFCPDRETAEHLVALLRDPHTAELSYPDSAAPNGVRTLQCKALGIDETIPG